MRGGLADWRFPNGARPGGLGGAPGAKHHGPCDSAERVALRLAAVPDVW
jgi:hypothetical protein